MANSENDFISTNVWGSVLFFFFNSDFTFSFFSFFFSISSSGISGNDWFFFFGLMIIMPIEYKDTI
jgi:hypothetical protein